MNHYSSKHNFKNRGWANKRFGKDNNNAGQNNFFHKLPPQSIESEQSILSSILLNQSALIEILDVLEPHHFYKDANNKIYSASVELFKKNEPVDLVTVTNHLRDMGELESVGGAAYITRLLHSIPMAPNIKTYAQIVRDKYILRSLITKSNAIMENCFENDGPVDDVLHFAENVIYDISQDKVKPSFYKLKEIISDSFEILQERGENESEITGIATGFEKLDKMTAGLQKSDLIILAARPSMGKTALALNIAKNASTLSKAPVAFFSLEMSKEQLAIRLLCSEARINSSKIRSGNLNKRDIDNLTYVAGVLEQAPIYIDDTPAISALEVRTKVRRLFKDQKNTGLVIIDYLQLMRVREGAERRDLAIAEISSSLKSLAKELEIPVIALSQLNRKLEERADKRPLLSDLRESGSLEQDADIVMFIYRDEVYNKEESNPNKGLAEILLRKQRNGPTGNITLSFLENYTRFENHAPEEVAQSNY